ncbi:hypothetical protein N7449_005888 [Penicillium cf. viridicatum]|uniref:Uncharacterized protein n=1 Tax=Penicillium cf. viridicatum TaxID=2972119 RepID=A0A9W9MGW7_9EURO|nr:hypothetical protein N7449_005888 [Penicillium cf. viridicatum]
MTVGKKKKEGHLGESNLILNINSLEVTHPTTNSPARGLCTFGGCRQGEKWVSAALASRDRGVRILRAGAKTAQAAQQG